MKRLDRIIFLTFVVSLIVVLCAAVRVSPGGGSGGGTLSSASFDASQFSVSGDGVVAIKAAAKATNFFFGNAAGNNSDNSLTNSGRFDSLGVGVFWNGLTVYNDTATFADGATVQGADLTIQDPAKINGNGLGVTNLPVNANQFISNTKLNIRESAHLTNVVFNTNAGNPSLTNMVAARLLDTAFLGDGSIDLDTFYTSGSGSDTAVWSPLESLDQNAQAKFGKSTPNGTQVGVFKVANNGVIIPSPTTAPIAVWDEDSQAYLYANSAVSIAADKVIHGNGAGVTNIPPASLQTNGFLNAQIPTFNGTTFVPSNAPAGAGGGFAALEIKTNGVRVGLVTNVSYATTSITGLLSGSSATIGSTVPDFQVFTNTATPGTWTKPQGATFVEVWCVGAGGGGGGGSAGATNSGSGIGGGTGGGGGATARMLFRASDLTSQVTATVGTNGPGGASAGVGGAGGTTSFGAYLLSYGGGNGIAGETTGVAKGGGGGGGTGAAGAAGAASGGTGGGPGGGAAAAAIGGGGGNGATTATGASAEYGGAGGAGESTSGVPGASAGSSLYGGGGGGAGGGLTTTGTMNAAIAGGNVATLTAAGGGTNGVSGSASPGGPGAGGDSTKAGQGGGGGGPNNGTSSTGGAGGLGGNCGGGGGGGGAGTSAGGVGGAGGRGEIRVYSW